MRHVLQVIYSRDNYNILVRSQSQFITNELIAHGVQRFSIQLIDGCIRPEKLLIATENIKNGNGLFEVNYDRIERVVINLNESSLLCCEGTDDCYGSIPEHCDVIYVKDVGDRRISDT